MSDDELMRQFEARTLPFVQWTHRAHVRIAFIYLSRHSFDDALSRIAAGIRAYNETNSVPESPTSGYNQTTTQAFTQLVAATMAAYGCVVPTADSDAFCERHAQLMTRNVLRLFYSPERRMDPRAKVEFVPPDLTPLPRIQKGDE